MKKILALLLVITCFSLSAQEIDSVQEIKESKHRFGKLIVKWSPLHLFNYYPTLQVAIEHRIAKNYALQYDFGPIVGGVNEEYNFQRFDKKGFKAKFEVRHYILPRSSHWRFYYGPEVYFNRVNYKKSNTYGVNCLDGNCEYYQIIAHDMRYREPGITLKTGAFFHVYRFCIDFQIGITGRFISYKAANEPTLPYVKIEEHDGFDFGLGIIERSRTILSPAACVRFGYILHY